MAHAPSVARSLARSKFITCPQFSHTICARCSLLVPYSSALPLPGPTPPQARTSRRRIRGKRGFRPWPGPLALHPPPLGENRYPRRSSFPPARPGANPSITFRKHDAPSRDSKRHLARPPRGAFGATGGPPGCVPLSPMTWRWARLGTQKVDDGLYPYGHQGDEDKGPGHGLVPCV